MADLHGKTLLITGASRGIGKAIALRAAQDGANVSVFAKTSEPHPKLPGTVWSAVEEINSAGGRGLGCIADIRFEDQVAQAVKQTVDEFGGLDILINNASAIQLTGTLQTEMKRFDLMHSVNTRGTFLVSRTCLPALISSGGQILNISPPLNLEPRWFAPHVAYTMAKYGMSLCVLGMAAEFRDRGVRVNALWPQTAIATAAIQNLLGGAEALQRCRKVDIMADAAHAVLTDPNPAATGQFLIDEDVLRAGGTTDFSDYAVNPDVDLQMDFFV